MCHSQFRAIYTDIKEVKTKNSKGSVKREDESSTHNPPVPFQHHSTSTFGLPEGRIRMTPFCVRQQAEAKGFMRQINSVSLKIGKYNLIVKETLWKINLTL